ncbi:MAG TPA: DNA-directed RNA polymerase subunit alpha C-terminal domain-containing protein [Gemmataceae bacterium]|jgi:DNA-directed RNA polymerase subunit alpha|nr:DNA-directed RNA polymerase subunit alpha C-terminal domain-containing protein [Gemmataceae bacterium]
MAEPQIDLKALLVEHEDCDAGTVQKLRTGLAQGGPQFRSLREVTETLTKRLETGQGNPKKLHLKLGIAYYFLGYMEKAAEHLRHAETALGAFYLGRALVARQEYGEALKAFDKAEKLGYTASTVRLQKAGIHLRQGDPAPARTILDQSRKEGLESHSAEYHFQVAGLNQSEGDRPTAVRHLERAVELDPAHTGALFQLGYVNDLAGNDDEAISYYERCLKHPPVHVGAVNNLGVLYEDNDKYDKAVECYGRLLKADPLDDRARLFFKDAQASLTMYYSPEEEFSSGRFAQVLETSVTDFELSVRARNCLKKMNIKTLGDLTRVTEQQLLASKNFGETSLQEINEIMRAKGLRLGQSLEQGAYYDRRGGYQTQNLSAEEQAVLSKPVSELNLSVRARKCMNRLGINSLGELVGRTADELLEAKNFGMTSLTEVREKLVQYGLKLRGD